MDHASEWVCYYSALHTATSRKDVVAHLSVLAASGDKAAIKALGEIKKMS